MLANIFVGFCESKLDTAVFPLFYKRYVDDTFSIFDDEPAAKRFHDVLNSMHPSLKFTIELESDNKLPFLDVGVHRVDDKFERSVYRKPTFTGLYTRWESFCDTRQKINLVKSLTSRAVKICSPSTLHQELDNLRQIFTENGYPSEVVNTTIKRVVEAASTRSANETRAATGPNDQSDKRVVLTLPWKGRVSTRFRKNIEDVVHSSFQNVRMLVAFSTRRAFSAAVKDVLPTTMQSNVVYQFTCTCKCAYVGRTSQQLGERVKQHIPAKLFTPNKNWKWQKSDSAITRHLKENPACIKEGLTKSFQVLARARHQQHLEILEAAFIKAKKPALCQQKDLSKALLLGT